MTHTAYVGRRIGGMSVAFVFQYGSNTSSGRLNSEDRLQGDARLLGLAYTVGQYDLGFTVWSRTNNCAAADLVRAPGRHVWGVLYDIPDHLLSRDTANNRRSLDEIEGPRYRRRKIKICRAGMRETLLTVWTYTVITRQNGLKTSRKYANHIITGLQENQAPQEYIDHVRTRVLKNNPGLEGQI